MKATKIIITAFVAVLALVSCEKNVWIDNADPQVYFAQYGFSENQVWDVQQGTYTVNFGVYFGGLRPDNRKTEITVGFAVNSAVLDDYNADVTQEFSGSTLALPADCYSISGTSVVIPAGAVSATIPVVFNLTAIAAAGLDPTKHYVIPLELTSTSEFKLNENQDFIRALLGVKVVTPSLYFYANRAGVTLASCKLVTGSDSFGDSFEIAGFGVPAGDYTVNVGYDAAAFAAAPTSVVPKSSLILPEDAVTIVTPTVSYKGGSDRPKVEVEYDPSKLEFLKAYYLPLSITSASAYGPNDSLKTTFVKVEKKNPYEKNYASILSVYSETTKRTGAYSAKKAPTSFADDVIELQIATNNTLAGAAANKATATTYNNKYMRIRIVQTADPKKYDVEYILVTDKSTRNNSPATFEADPDNPSYYDWDKEQFVLNYRWRHPDNATGEWVTVSEIMQAN